MSILEQVDTYLAEAVASWNTYTTLLAVVLALLIAYPVFTSNEPDIHPLLLSRQARPSPIRRKNESATYRGLDVPVGYPLRSGLDIRDPGEPRWKAGRDGDLRDIWRAAMRGGAEGSRGEIMTTCDSRQVFKHDTNQLSRQIAILGHYLEIYNVKRMAICLPNAVELLCALFACIFYSITPILVPFGQSEAKMTSMLRRVHADALITQEGTFAVASMRDMTQYRQIILVVDEASKYTNCAEEGERYGRSVRLHDLIRQRQEDGTPQLPIAKGYVAPDLEIWSCPSSGSDYAVTKFTQKNIVAGVVGALFSLPAKHRFAASDIILAADTLCRPYVLCQVLAALFSHSDLILGPVAGDEVDLQTAARHISPTVIIASSDSVKKLHDSVCNTSHDVVGSVARYIQRAALDAGRLAKYSFVSQYIKRYNWDAMYLPSAKLRLIMASQPTGSMSAPMTGSELNDLRISTGARISIALTAPNVAGAVTQTNIFDYRTRSGEYTSHVGIPPPCVEIKLRNASDKALESPNPTGEVVVIGPAVAGGEAALSVQGLIRDDCTLAIPSQRRVNELQSSGAALPRHTISYVLT